MTSNTMGKPADIFEKHEVRNYKGDDRHRRHKPTPLSILLERAEVLQHLYGRVIIPEAVVRELQAQKTPAVVRRWITSPPEWLQIRQIAVPPDPALAELDLGEREAIALAETLRADALIIDEKMGRREAERRKLRVIGTEIGRAHV